MAIIRYKEIEKMSEKERNEKLDELKLQMVKSEIGKKGKTKELKRTIARIFTFNASKKGVLRE